MYSYTELLCALAWGLLQYPPMAPYTSMRLGFALLAMGVAAPAFAAVDPLVEGARQCTQQFPTQESRNGIPTHLLAAISSTESGRWHDGLGLALPWPWTINVEGKGYYFDSKAEAIAKTRAHMAQGARSLDIGCLQVNLKHHPNAFRNLEEAFDPAHNVAYGAKFLRSNYDELGDWIKATAAYHSRTNQRGNAYLARIEKAWNRIVGKVAAARARQGLPATEAQAPGEFNVAGLPAELPQATGRTMRPIASTRNVRVIQVSEKQRPAGTDVLVIRTSDTATVPAAPAATPAAETMLQRSGDTVRRVTIDNSGRSSDIGGNTPSTRFVFAN